VNRISLVLLIILGVLLSACSGAGDPIGQATAIPATSTPTPTETPLPTPTETLPPTATVELPPVDATPVVDGSTPDPVVAACVLGTWEMSGVDALLMAALVGETVPFGPVEYQGSTGVMRYTFLPDGELQIQAGQYASQFRLTSGSDTYNLIVVVNGGARANYRLTADRLIVENIRTDDLTVTGEVDGSPVLTGDKGVEMARWYIAAYNSARYTCDGDLLTLQLVEFMADAQPVILTRVTP
jgi:hypothetical protein